jgi:hypothetical protein
MKEYTITFKIYVQSYDSNYEQVEEYANQLVEKILENDELIYSDEIDVTDISVEEIEDNSSFDSFDEDGNYDFDEND